MLVLLGRTPPLDDENRCFAHLTTGDGLDMRDCGLSQRQRECLEGRLEHKTAKEIGRQLKISHNTVNMHLRLARLPGIAE